MRQGRLWPAYLLATAAANGQWRRSSVVVVDNSFVFAGDSFFLAVGLFDYLCVL
jgi:hypothetical protein